MTGTCQAGRLTEAAARRLAAMLTDRQRADIVRLARIIQGSGP